jgi:hypothetical protein
MEGSLEQRKQEAMRRLQGVTQGEGNGSRGSSGRSPKAGEGNSSRGSSGRRLSIDRDSGVGIGGGGGSRGSSGRRQSQDGGGGGVGGDFDAVVGRTWQMLLATSSHTFEAHISCVKLQPST